MDNLEKMNEAVDNLPLVDEAVDNLPLEGQPVDNLLLIDGSMPIKSIDGSLKNE